MSPTFCCGRLTAGGNVEVMAQVSCLALGPARNRPSDEPFGPLLGLEIVAAVPFTAVFFEKRLFHFLNIVRQSTNARSNSVNH